MTDDHLPLNGYTPLRRWSDLTLDEQWDVHEQEMFEAFLRENPGEVEIRYAQHKLEVQREARRRVAVAADRRGFDGLEAMTLEEAFAAPREVTPWLVEGLQRAGHIATLVAQFKTGKTTFAANLVRCLADTQPFLDRFAVPALTGRIAVFDYELQVDDALDMYRALGLRNPQRVYVETLRGRGMALANDSHAERVVQMLRENEVEYWVLDPFGNALRGFGEENSNDHVRAFFTRVQEIAYASGVQGVLLPVHTGRADPDVGAERARGATVLDDAPDVRWVLTRDGARQRYFRAEGRSGVDVEEFALVFDRATSRLSASEETRADLAGARHKPAVVAFVTQNPGASVRDIKDGVSGRDGDVASALRHLLEEGVLTRQKDGAAQRHYLGEGPAETEVAE